MLQPQSDEEIRPVIEALRRLDPLLDIKWNPRAIRIAKGFDVRGSARAAEYDGRWEVVRYETATKLHDDRDWTRITQVTALTWEGADNRRYPVMLADGPYAPIGFWLVDYMALWDRAQTAWAGAMDRLWASHDQAETATHNRDASQEALEKVYREHGGQYWMGGAQGKAAPETERTLFGAATSPTSP